ncbi:MAG: alpha/beta hydrolase [Erythrobacter sp.]|jgi:acetyl esterase/lipase|uniref:alpha/beta hydrolase n=1 Tax=Erythrobacter sp. TaxID=1042 RepID=UPI002B469847|nr:alpha/beta hydrolase [Erythrobacter sp.]WRH70386.1 MAG: alpha/beta hydrolase [Erythrobacter sp.]
MNTATRTLLALSAAAVLATPILAQRNRDERLPRECREEIVRLCGMNRGELRNCLREKYAQLSESCAASIRERMEAQRGAGEGAGARRGPGMGARAGAGAGAGAYASAKISSTVVYGDHLRQQVDVYTPDSAVGDAPLVVFIHGGGWQIGNRGLVQAKPQHFKDAGYVFASAGYRLLPDAPVEQQAADIGAAIKALRGQAQSGGFDPDTIVLMGHSAGAHLAALVATDPQYAGDEAFAAIKGVVLLDGAGYDVVNAAATPTMELPTLYKDVFGTDPARQKALSPITHVGGKDAPHWLALYVAERPGSKMQSEALTRALAKAGADASAVAITGTDHGRMNRDLGTDAGKAQTDAVDAFLKKVFG